MKFIISALATAYAAAREVMNAADLSKVDYDTSIAIQATFDIDSVSFDTVREWSSYFEQIDSVDLPVISVQYNGDRAYQNMIFSSACALDTYFAMLEKREQSSPFSSALIYGYVPEGLEDSLNDVFPENQVFAEASNINYFGVPTRGIISTPPTDDSEEIMVNLSWYYDSVEEADKANSDIKFMLQYLTLKKANPDLIYSWDLQRLDNQFVSSVIFPDDKAYQDYLDVMADFPFSIEDVVKRGNLQNQSWLQSKPTRKSVLGVTEDYLFASAPNSSIFSNKLSLSDQEPIVKNSSCITYNGEDALSGERDIEKPTEPPFEYDGPCLKRKLIDVASLWFDLYTINDLLTQWFDDRDGYDFQRHYSFAALQMLSLTSDLLHTNLGDFIGAESSMVSNVGYSAAALRSFNFLFHVYDYITDNNQFSIMSAIYSNMVNLPLMYAVDQNCQLNYISLASAVLLPATFTLVRHMQCNDEAYFQAYIDAPFMNNPNHEAEFMRAINNCQFFGYPLGKFDEIYYEYVYPAALIQDGLRYMHAFSLAGTDVERETVFQTELAKGPITLLSLYGDYIQNNGLPGGEDVAKALNELIALGADVDGTELMLYGLTPLHLTTMLQLPELVKVLIANGADPTKEVPIQEEEIEYAAWQLKIENEEIKQMLKKHLQDYFNYDFLQQVPDVPLLLEEKEDLRDIAVLGLQWTAPYFVGLGQVQRYQIFGRVAGTSGPFLLAAEASNTFVAVNSIDSTSLVPGTTYEFRVEAQNSYGNSVHTEPITLKCGYFPTQPSSTTIFWNRDTDDVEISWLGVAANGYTITKIEVKVWSEYSRSYLIEDNYCVPTSSSVLSGNSCNIPITTLRYPVTFGLDYGDYIRTEIYVTNEFGKQQTPGASGLGSFHYVREPSMPRSLSEDINAKTSREFTVIWGQPEILGGLDLINYQVYSQEGSSAWSLAKTALPNVRSVSLACTARLTYGVKVYAKNSEGTSQESNNISSYCGAEPDSPSTPSTSVTANQATLSWTAPFDGGYDILDYTVYIIKSTSSFEVSSSDCVTGHMGTGSTSCTLMLDTLAAAPFNLLQGDDITIQVKARNSYGDSDLSASGSGGVMVFVPDAPRNLQDIPSITLEDRIGISWIAGGNDGGEQVIDYQIHYDAGRGDGVFELLLDNITPQPVNQRTFNGLTSGTTYTFKVRSRNSVGFSDFTSEVSILAAQIPYPPLPPTTTFDILNVHIDWSASPSGGSDITSYEIKIRGSDELTYYTLPNCGSDPTVFRCTIIIEDVLKVAPYNLPWGAEVFALITAKNNYGKSMPSYQGGGAIILTNPIDVTDLTVDPLANGVTYDTTIKMSWTDPDVNFGGTPVIDYTVYQKDDVTNTWAEGQTGITDTFVTMTGFTLGVTYTFRVKARNAFDLSKEYSNEVSQLAARAPYQIAAPTATYSYADQTVTINWDAPNNVAYPPANGGSPITHYTVTIRQSDGTTFTEETVSCDGDGASKATILSSHACTILVTDLMAPPFNIAWGGFIVAKVKATNDFGIGDFSSEGSEGTDALIYTKPGEPTGLALKTDGRARTTLDLEWTAPTFNGGVTLVDYRVSQETAGVWAVIAENNVATSYLAENLVPGDTYKFRVESKNTYVHSDYSTELELEAGYIPDAITVLSSSQTVGVTDVILNWDAPTNNGGSEITRYTIKIEQSDSTFTEDTVNCDGSTTAVKDATQCTIPLATLRAAPYTLTAGSAVRFTVTATNKWGETALSSTGDGAYFYNPPDAPTTLAEDSDTTLRTTTQLALTWVAGANNGGTDVRDYRIWYSENSGAWLELATGVTTPSYTASGLNTGSTYKFKVESRNDYYYSTTYSNELELLCAYISDVPTVASSTVTTNQVTLSWNAPASNGGSEITGYVVKIKTASGTYSQDITNCPATGLVTSCTFLLSVLSAAPYNLVAGNTIEFSVAATNQYGTTADSAAGGAALMIVPPDAPTNLSMTAEDADNFQVTLTWDEGAQNGGASVDSYEIEYDQRVGTWIQLTGASALTVKTFTFAVDVTSPVSFKIRATNQAGTSAYSSTFTFPDCALQTSLNGQTYENKRTLINTAFTTNMLSSYLGLATDCSAFGADRSSGIQLNQVLFYGVKYDKVHVSSLALLNGAMKETTMGGLDEAPLFAQNMRPLHYAALYCSFNVAQLLINKGADLTAASSSYGRRPLHMTSIVEATVCSSTQVLQVLVTGGADINHQDTTGNTALMSAIRDTSNLALIDTFIANSANMNLLEVEGASALYWAQQSNWYNRDATTYQTMYDKLVAAGAVAYVNGAQTCSA